MGIQLRAIIKGLEVERIERHICLFWTQHFKKDAPTYARIYIKHRFVILGDCGCFPVTSSFLKSFPGHQK